MNVIKDYFDHAGLSQAAYADLPTGTPSVSILSSEQVGMSLTQAAEFAARWRVIGQHADSANGLSVTVFEDVSTGIRNLAVRGTEGLSDPNDLWTDFVDITVLGAPERQAQYAALRDQVAAWLSDGTLSSGFTVTGHSLGGFLSGALLVDYSMEISHAYLYNAPGVGGLSAGLRLLAGWETEPDLDLSKISNVIAQAGPSLIAGLGLDWSSPFSVVIEDQSPTITGNHSIVPLTDALAVVNLLSNVQPSLTLSEAGAILEAASSQPADSLERIVNALGDLLGAGTSVAVGIRDELYDRIQAIQAELSLYPNISLTALHDDDPQALATAARAEKGFLYALEHLNPFAVVGSDSLYDDLDPADFSDAYLEDRARLLNDKLARAIEDDTRSQDFGPYAGTPVHFIDRDSAYGIRILPSSPGLRIEFGSDNEGIAGDDALSGTVNVDHLYGRKGDDALAGGKGDDYLEGGQGTDTYLFNAGDGVDTIYDADGLGSILVRSGGVDTPLGGTIDGVPGSSNLYEDGDGNRYGRTGNDLHITLAVGGQIILKEYTDGMLGISLNPAGDPSASQAPTGTPVFTLGQFPEHRYILSPSVIHFPTHPDYDISWYGDPYRTEVIEALGAIGPTINDESAIITGQVAGGLGDSYMVGDAGFNYLIDDLYYSVDSLAGTPVEWLSGDPVWEPYLQGGVFFSLGNQAGADVLYGGGGNDWLFSHGGDDWLYGEDGDDFLYDNPGLDFGDNRWLALPGASSDDHLFGGPGNDILITLQGEDHLDGGDGNDVLLSGQGDDTLVGGGGSDWLLADAAINRRDFIEQPDGSFAQLIEAADADTEYGQDTLFGDAGDDVLAGGGGDDWLLGGADNDTLWGDGSSIITEAGAIQISAGDGAVAGNDTLFGEQGDDTLIGGGGADYLDGGDGNDALEGDLAELDAQYHGDDTLFGGSGDDVLIGNGGNDSLSGDAGNDQLWGDAGDDSLFGGDGIDTLDGGADNDLISAGAGDDKLTGGTGHDGLFGDAGLDSLDGGDGNDVLSGGAGNDEVYGSAGDDLLEGGSGTDSLFGGEGNDVYLIDTGSGQDTIVDTSGSNSIAFGAGITPGGLNLLEIRGNDGAYYLAIEYGASGDRVLIRNGPLGSVSSFSFADGTVLSFAELMAQAGLSLTGNGSEGDDFIQGGNAADLLLGGGGSDEIHGGDGADQLIGGSGDDRLNGDAGDDALNGGVGNDELRGGPGTDSYRLHWGMGQDTLVDTGVESSVLQLDAGIALTDLVMSRDGNDLLVQFKGVSDGVRIKDYSLGGQLWEVRSDDGAVTVIDDVLIDGAAAGAVDSAAAAIERYETNVESIFFSTRGENGSVAGPDGALRRTTSRATNFGATTEFFNESFTIIEQWGDAASMTRQSPAYYDSTRTLLSTETVSSGAFNVGVGQTSLDTSGGAFNPLSGAATALPPGATVLNAYGRPQDLDGDLSLDTGGYTRPIGYWVFPGGAGAGSFPGVQFNPVQHITYETNGLLTLERITAGASDNRITTSGYSVVDAGAGNDTVVATFSLDWQYNQQFHITPYQYDQPFDPRNAGSLLYGNSGDDNLTGGGANDVLIGGAGDDLLDGGSGEDTYLVTVDGAGWDILADSGRLAEHPETFQTRYQDWYYRSIGMADWQERELGGETLPPLPVVSINDYASIRQLSDDGVIETDSVEFGDGIALSDLTISWGEHIPQAGEAGAAWMDAGSVHATLDISWAPGSGIRIVMPHASPIDNEVNPDVLDFAPGFDVSRFDKFLGTGIERFLFADGARLSTPEMLARAPQVPTLDPHELDNIMEGTAASETLIGWTGDDVMRGGAGSDVYIFNQGDGSDRIEDNSLDGDVNLIRFGDGISPSDVNVLRSGDGIRIEVGSHGDAISLVSTDAGNTDGLQAVTSLLFPVVDDVTRETDDYMEVTLADLVPPRVSGEQIEGTEGDDRIVGSALDDVLQGLQGNDVIRGLAGDDTIIGGAGRDRLAGGDGDDTFLVEGVDAAFDRFVGGEGIDTIAGGDGDDVIRVRRFGPENDVEVIDGAAGSDVIAGTDRRDRIDLSATATRNIERIDGGAGNDVIIASDGPDTIVGGPGRDALNGGEGSDRYLFFRGDGRDRITDRDPGSNSDAIAFGGDIRHDQIWFTRVGDDLALQVIGTRDAMKVENWYLGSEHQIELFYSGDALTLANTQVDQLVQAMAAFSPPRSGETEFAPDLAETLAPVLAASWETA